MNIHQNRDDLRTLLEEGSRITGGKKATKKKKTYFPGVYIISRRLDYNLFKLGESHGQGTTNY